MKPSERIKIIFHKLDKNCPNKDFSKAILNKDDTYTALLHVSAIIKYLDEQALEKERK